MWIEVRALLGAEGMTGVERGTAAVEAERAVISTERTKGHPQGTHPFIQLPSTTPLNQQTPTICRRHQPISTPLPPPPPRQHRLAVPKHHY